MKTLEFFGDFLLTTVTVFLGGITAPLLVSIFLAIFTDTFFSDCLYSPFFWIGSCAGWLVYTVNLHSARGI
jgi:hypothetical protein